jgi:hypothetical protein
MAIPNKKKSTDRKTSTNTATKRKNFSGFNLKEAFKQLKLREIQPWEEHPKPAVASNFFPPLQNLLMLKRAGIMRLKTESTLK